MRAWQKRSVEEANLLNPAFLGMISYQCVRGYHAESKCESPFVLPFIVTPLVLHKQLRNSLPGMISVNFAHWVVQPKITLLKTRYAQRCGSLVPYIKESLLFATQNKVLEITGTSNWRAAQIIRVSNDSVESITQEVVDCYKKAFFCGRWFANSGRIETIMALLGIKP